MLSDEILQVAEVMGVVELTRTVPLAINVRKIPISVEQSHITHPNPAIRISL